MYLKPIKMRYVILATMLALTLWGSVARAQERQNIYQSVLGESDQRIPEISTMDIRRILAERSAIVFDARPFREFAISHIPGARSLSAKPGVSRSMYISDVAEVGRVVGGDRSAAVVLYCNGPFCGKVNRLGKELLAAGHTNVQRYQLGIPVWRVLGGVTEIEGVGLRYVIANDASAVLIDAREAETYKSGTLASARNLPRSGVIDGKDVGEVRRAKDDGRLPTEDHNTRLIVVGRDAGEARHVAEALVLEAFHNVAYFPGTFEEARAALQP
ncbi:MAG: rhodanese-like domain-containing protein [Rhodocyclaceae bacterium]|nr:rhodanese-like domain-containing protein [Rhodocyclaceae bacterium]